MLTDNLIKLAIFLILLLGIRWLILHIELSPGAMSRSCRDCFWLYNHQTSVFCSDPDTPVRYLDKFLIKKFHCSRWSKHSARAECEDHSTCEAMYPRSAFASGKQHGGDIK
jgi:hypothetical protein